MRGMLQTITVEGLNMERLITQAGEHGVQLLGMRRTGSQRLTGCVRAEDLPVLLAMAQEGGWKLTTGAPAGWGRVAAFLKKRRFTCALCLLALLAASAASMVMWRVEVIDAGAYEADIHIALSEAGITPPKLRTGIDVAQLRDMLEWRYPRIAWIECGWRGSTLRIRVVEGVQSDDAKTLTGCTDVIASRAGLVTGVVTLAGTPVVQAGQTVLAGEVLIRGEERGTNGETYPVAARGSVTARVWDGAAIRVSGTGVETTWTGREEEQLEIASPWFMITAERRSPFLCADAEESRLPLGGLFLPLMISRVRYMEAERTETQLPDEELRAQAEALALRRLQEMVGFGEEFVDKWVDYSKIENGDIIATAIGERVIDIARRSDPP